MKVFLIFLIMNAILAGETLLNNPESVEYDPVNKRYLVFNFGDGAIVQIDSVGSQSYFDTTMTRLRALHRVGDTLFAAANLEPYIGIAGYDLREDSLVLFIPIEGSGLLNDITSDTGDILYVTDYYDSEIYRVDPDSKDVAILVNSGLSMPNGIVFDDRYGRLITHSNNAPRIPLHSVDPINGTVTDIVRLNRGGVDGIVFDKD